MSKAYSLHIGLNKVSPRHYNLWEGELVCCENDAKEMQRIANYLEYDQSILLLSKDATRENVTKHFLHASQSLSSGDFFLLTFSGHGASIIDQSGDEKDNKDESWCLYDWILIDDQIHALLKSFRSGVHIFVLSDSCHSASVIKSNANHSPGKMKNFKSKVNLYASVCLISGCQDHELSYAGAELSAFTDALVQVWATGQFEGNYFDFHQAIKKKIAPKQYPGLYILGPETKAFKTKKPFII